MAGGGAKVEELPRGTGTPKVTWDTSEMKSSYANVCNVSSTREEVVLTFGINQTWTGAQDEVKVQLTDRLILSPFAAKRLAALLSNVVEQYQARFGDLGPVTQPGAGQSG
jgi:hypothetical protein